MFTRMIAPLGLLMLSLGTLFGQDKDATPGNPPVVLLASEIDANGALILVEYRTIFFQPTQKGGGGPVYNDRSLSKTALKDVKIYGKDGKEITVDAARKRLAGKETPILASSWGQKLPPFYRKVFQDDMLLFAFPQEAPAWRTIAAPELPVR